MILDKKVGEERKQFASQSSEIPTEVKVDLDTTFIGKESTEFYEGLLAGYACAYQLLQLPEIKRNLGYIIAYLSEILEERS